MNWPWKKKPALEPPIKVQLVRSNTLTLTQWRKQTSLVASGVRLAGDSTFQMALAVLENEHPRHLVMDGVGISPNDRIAHECMIAGYQKCLNNLALLRQPWKISKPLEATFAPPEEPKSQ